MSASSTAERRRYVFHFRSALAAFRVPEIEATAEVFGLRPDRGAADGALGDSFAPQPPRFSFSIVGDDAARASSEAAQDSTSFLRADVRPLPNSLAGSQADEDASQRQHDGGDALMKHEDSAAAGSGFGGSSASSGGVAGLGDLDAVRVNGDGFGVLAPWMAAADVAVACLASRSIVCDGAFLVLAEAHTLDDLVEQTRTLPVSTWDRFIDPGDTAHGRPRATFRCDVFGFGIHYHHKDQIEVFRRFTRAGIPLWANGIVDTRKPMYEFAVLDDHGVAVEPKADGDVGAASPQYMFVLRVGPRYTPRARGVIERFSVKKRKYIGTTSMDAELSLIMSNMAWARPGTLMLDPFVGTGSCLVTSAHFGSMTFGWDIDARPVRGGKGVDIRSNFAQYGLEEHFGGLLIADSSRSPTRGASAFTSPSMLPPSRPTLGWLDLIVSDPPYGAREGSKRIGKRAKTAEKQARQGPRPPKPADKFQPRYAQKLQYSTTELMLDLLQFATRSLLVGGRLVFWYPTTIESYSWDTLPRHPCLRVVAASLQKMAGSTANGEQRCRVLVTMMKVRDPTPEDLEADARASAAAASERENATPRAVFAQKLR
jgi:tRNA (guanine10-N2)-methyltransferase